MPLAENSYGKSGVRLVKVVRGPDGHDVKDLTVDIALEGDFEAAHLAGDNSLVLPTDTMKNTVYALARQQPVDAIEDFAILLGQHFLDASHATERARVHIVEHAWEPLAGELAPAHAFQRSGAERRVCWISARKGSVRVEAGIEGLLIMKTTHSAFKGYPRDKYTTLPETDDRILATEMSARWTYSVESAAEIGLGKGFNGAFAKVRTALLESFANHKSLSVQHTLYWMGEAALAKCEAVEQIHITMPNKHHLLFDVGRFGFENANEIFVPTEEPYGLIEATIVR
jgi:urate oxidase